MVEYLSVFSREGLSKLKKKSLTYRPAVSQGKKKVSFVISSSHACAVDKSIAQKIARNEIEKRASREAAAKYVVG